MASALPLILSSNEQAFYRAKIEAYSVPEPNSGCLLWLGAMHPFGYGVTKLAQSRRQVTVHRLSWASWFGPLEGPEYVLHRCDVPCCSNPDHLFLGDHDVNMADMVAKGRQSIGVRNGQARLTEADIEIIREDSGSALADLAEAFAVSKQTISDIQIGRQWAAGPGPIRRKQAVGEDCRHAKLTSADVIAIRADTTSTQSALAAEHGVTRELISRIKRGLVWKQLLATPETEH